MSDKLAHESAPPGGIARYWDGPVRDLATVSSISVSEAEAERHRIYALLTLALVLRYWNGNKRGVVGDYPWRSAQKIDDNRHAGDQFGDRYLGHNIACIAVDDPLLAGTMASALIDGIQSNNIVSTIKHFAVNDQETQRTSLDETISAEAMRHSDLLAFELAMERGKPGSVMCSYNLINGRWGCENDYLLNKVLKGDWAFKGFVMSDWGAVHSTTAANDGLDQFTGFCCSDNSRGSHRAPSKLRCSPAKSRCSGWTTWPSASCGHCSPRGRWITR